MNSVQSEWRQEQSRLSVSRQHGEAELLSAMHELATSAYSQHFHSTHTHIHQLARDMTALLEERRQAEQSREEWLSHMTVPCERARAMMAQVRSKAGKVERETRLMATQREEERTALRSSLQQLMRGLRHQCKVFGEELQQQRSEVEAGLAEYNSEWLARMSDDRIEEESNTPDALLVINAHWQSSLSPERRDEAEAARRQWIDRWDERRDMMDRLFTHKREHARQQLDERVTALKRFGGTYGRLANRETHRGRIRANNHVTSAGYIQFQPDHTRYHQQQRSSKTHHQVRCPIQQSHHPPSVELV